MLKLMPAALVLIASVPAAAQQSSSTDKAKDPNRIICERYEETGSRLASKKICKTAREWEEERQAIRKDVERAQQGTGGLRTN